MRPDQGQRAPRPGAPRSAGPRDKKSSRAVLGLLLLASFTVITLDARGGDSSPLDPVRSVAGDAFGPVETAAATAVRPFAALPDHFRTTDSLRRDVAALRSQNSELRSELAGSALSRHQVTELAGLRSQSSSTGYALVPAHVVAMGPAQSFSRTVTIDAGTRAGVHPDMTVMDNDGLVGRVVRADRSTATVLLIVDQESVVGGRLGSSMEVGFLRGRGRLDGGTRLDLELVDGSATAARGDSLVTWGSKNGRPFVPGIPVGKVTSLVSSPRSQSTRAVISPYVDFSSLDLVGVVVKRGTKSDRTVIEAGRQPAGGDR